MNFKRLIIESIVIIFCIAMMIFSGLLMYSGYTIYREVKGLSVTLKQFNDQMKVVNDWCKVKFK